MASRSPYRRKHLYEGHLKESLTGLTPAAQIQYITRIGESVKKRLRVEKRWTEQPQKCSDLFIELRRLYPDILNDWAIEQASVKFAQAFFSHHRKKYLVRTRRQACRSGDVDRSLVAASVKTSVPAGPRLRQRQAQESNAGLSNAKSQPRPAKFSIGAAFVASSYMERVLQSSEEQSSHGDSIENDNPPVRKRPANVSRNLRPVRRINTADPKTNTRIDSNERIKCGTDEVKAFLESCSPSMAHHFDSFIRAGVKNGEYLKAVGRLCASNTDVLSPILGPDSSVIDSILLQAHFLTWSKEVIQDGGGSERH